MIWVVVLAVVLAVATAMYEWFVFGLMGKPANCLVLDADSPFEAVHQRADVLASIRNSEYRFKRPESSYEIALDLFRKTK